MPSKFSQYSRAIFRRRVERLQKAGLIGKVDFRRKPSVRLINKVAQYNDVLTGKSAVVKATSNKAARELRSELGLRGQGRSVVVGKERGEKFSISRTGKIVSRRRGPQGETIRKELTRRSSEVLREHAQATPKNARYYYTLPSRRRGLRNLKRTTFASFDEMLYYLEKYEINFEDIEDYVEIETVERGSTDDETIEKKISKERARARARNAKKKRSQTVSSKRTVSKRSRRTKRGIRAVRGK